MLSSSLCLHLTHLPLVPPSKSDQHWFKLWLVTYSVPSHYLNQCCFLVNCMCTLRNKLQRNFNQNIKLLIHENASVKWQPFCQGGDELNSYQWDVDLWNIIFPHHFISLHIILYHLFGMDRPHNRNIAWQCTLTHLPPVLHICVSELGQHWFR